MKPEGGVFDPETLDILRRALDDAWAQLTPEQQARIGKSALAQKILNAAAEGDPVRLRTRALLAVVAPP